MADQFDYQKTFGAPSFCDCVECRSIHSAAAYLVDILMFLDDPQRATLFGPKKRAADPQPLAVRRPDLGEIELSCANTNTPLPYIDLVNEVLEYAVTATPVQNQPAAAPPEGWPQTRGTAQDVAVNPERIISAAYDIVRREIHSWRLPFDLWNEQSRAFLRQLGSPRAEIMDAFRAASPTDAAIAAEQLGISPIERRVITSRLRNTDVRAASTGVLALSALVQVDGVQLKEGDRVLVKDQALNAGHAKNGIWIASANAWTRAPDADVTTLHDGFFVEVQDGTQMGTRWVLTTKEPIVVDTTALTIEKYVGAGTTDASGYLPWQAWFPADPGNDWTRLYEKVDLWLTRSGLSFAELRELLHTRFINDDPAHPIKAVFSDDSCNVAKATFVPKLTDAHLQRMHRFVRLQRKLGWSARDLDRAMAALSAKDIDDRLVIELSHVKRLLESLGVPLLVALSWWADLDTTRGEDDLRSFFEELFQNPAVVDAKTALEFALKWDAPNARWELDKATDTVEQHAVGIAAAVGIDAADLALLVGTLSNHKFTVASLSALHRSASLARALDLSVGELLTLKKLSGLDPFPLALPSGTSAFVAAARQVRTSAFSTAELDYLLADVLASDSALAPEKVDVDALIDELRSGLKKIAMDADRANDPTGDLLRPQLDALLSGQDLSDALAFVVNPTPFANPTKFIKDHFGGFITDVADALKNLVTTPLPLEERRTYLFRAYLRSSLGESLILSKLASPLKIDTALLGILLRRVIHAARATTDPLATRTAMEELLDLGGGGGSAAADTHRKLWKAALVLQKLKLSADRFGTAAAPAWLGVFGPALGWLNLDALPPVGAPDPNLFIGWSRLVDLAQAWPRRLPAASVFEAFDIARTFPNGGNVATARTALLTTLAAATGWDLGELQSLAGTKNTLGLAFPGDYLDERLLARLRRCFSLMRRAGGSAAQIDSWKTPDDEVRARQVAMEIVKAAKAKHDDATWHSVARPLRDALRGRQRDALVAYLVGHRGFADSNELFSWFLLDPEVDPCLLTSRIKQAIGSVQLFIQRALMNLEQITLGVSQAQHWITWMKSYRIWEANRKVFLYPENWIEPELRDDKTPFFRELENELSQREVTKESIEEAFQNYLEKLDGVARLQIAGVVHDAEKRVLHVLARTFNDPHVHYYRRLSPHLADPSTASTWSPWERVDLDISGDHLIPVIHNRRLNLFWPIFTLKSQAPSDYSSAGTEWWEIQLAWSEYKSGKWSPRKLSSPERVVRAKNLPTRGDDVLKPFTFRGWEDSSGDLTIEVLWSGERTSDNPELDASWFTLSGCANEPVAGGDLQRVAMTGLDLPPNTRVDRMAVGSDAGPLTFTETSGVETPLLNKIPSAYRLFFQRLSPDVLPPECFFYQDTRRTFYAQYVEEVKIPIDNPTIDIVIEIPRKLPYPFKRIPLGDPVRMSPLVDELSTFTFPMLALNLENAGPGVVR